MKKSLLKTIKRKEGCSKVSWNLLGFDHITAALSQMIKRGRLPHALLLTGPLGSGKNSLARALAQALNCETNSPGQEPCGQCRSCIKIIKNIHPDIRTIIPSGRSHQIKMEDIQNLRVEMGFRPYEGRSKIFIIREADRLNNESGNALLKTLEEPPPDSVMILTSASEYEIMPTILSRCLRLKVPSLPYSTVLACLRERKSLDDERARLLAALSDGALGIALELDVDEVWAAWQELNAVLGAKSPAQRLEAAWKWVAAVANNEEKYPLILKLMRFWWRQSALAKLNNTCNEGPAFSEAQIQWSLRLNSGSLQKIHKSLAKLEDSLSRFVKADLAFENYWLSIFSS